MLGEYTKHHVKEEGELFPGAQAKMDTAATGAQLAERKAELTEEAREKRGKASLDKIHKTLDRSSK